MKLTTFIGLFTFILLFSGVPISAQELDHNTFVSLVKAHNGDLQLSANQQKATTEDTKIAKALLLPNISTDGSYQRDFNKNFLFINDGFGGVSEFQTNFNNTVDVSAVASQVLYDAEALSTVKLARLAEELTKLNHENASAGIVAQASALYWQSIFLKESIAVLETNSNLAKEQFEQIEKIYQNGEISLLQLYQAKGLYKSTLPPLNNAKTQYQNLLTELKTLANIPVTDTIVLTDNLEQMQLTDFILAEENLELQPQIKAVKKEIEIANQELEGKKKFWLPKVNLIAAYNYNGQDDNFRFKNNENKLFFGQVRISIPIFSGGSNRAKIAKAEIEKQSAMLHLDNTRRNLLKALKTAENDYNKALENIKLNKETIAINESEIDIFRKQLSLDVVTPLQFKESRLQLTQNRLALLNSYLDLQIAGIQINRILGNNN